MLTPAQIRGHRFAPAVRGAYKAEEVDVFFAEVLESYEKALNDNGELLKRISLLAERVEAYRNDEDNIKVALLTAQRMADKMVKDANETAAEQLKSAAEKLAYAEAQATAQAKMLIEKAQKEADDKTLNAEIEADRLVKDARTEAAEMRRTATQEAQEQLAAVREDVRMETILLASLRREAEEFKNALLQLYNKHLSLIDSMPGEVAQTFPHHPRRRQYRKR
jgi:cell division initiation protein